MKAKLVQQFQGRIRLANGKRPYVFSYDLGKYYKAEKVTDFLKSRIKNIPDHYKLFFAANARYQNLDNRTHFSGYMPETKFNIYPPYLVDSQMDIGESRIRYVSLYVLNTNPNKVQNMFAPRVGDDKHNDCLFNAIVDCFDRQNNLLPRQINHPRKGG